MLRFKDNDDDCYGFCFNFFMFELEYFVLIGYVNGVIIFNVSEVDVIYREMICIKMGENYCMFLGYFCYESGYYYFDFIKLLYFELVDEFCQYFGDEC